MNSIAINGAHNTTEMRDVPQNVDSAGLVLFLVGYLQGEGYRGMRVSADNVIYYHKAPEGTLKPPCGYYVQAHGEETATYVQLLEDK